MKIRYENKKISDERLAVVEQGENICLEYAAQGFALTLRQLYYQFVARDLLPNSDPSYKRLGDIINDARLAGEFDWDFIIDRTRNLQQLPTWGSPQHLLEKAAERYLTDTWAPQKRRVEVWIEKDAAIGVIEHVCDRNNVPFFSCRGYTSTSEMWEAGNRIGEYLRNGEQTVILHIGDHDPSGLDMTRYIEERLRLFISRDWANQFMGFGAHTRGAIRASQIERMREQGCDIADDALPWEVRRIALTMDQIDEYQPPPNYAKQSDARFQRYYEETGLTDSWELDALDPIVMEELIQDHIDSVRVQDKFDQAEAAQEHDRAVLIAVKDNWETIQKVHGKVKK